MRNSNPFLWSLLLVLIYSCKNESTVDEILIRDNLNVSIYVPSLPKHIIGKNINELDKLAQPDVICLIDSFLVIADSKSDRPLHIININSNKYYNLGFFGKGPGEVLNIFSLSSNNKIIWAPDFTLQKMIGYELDSLISVNGMSYKSEIEVNLNGFASTFRDPIALSDSLFIGLNRYGDTDARFSIVNKEGDHIRSIGKTPVIPGEKSIRMRNEAYAGQFYLHPNKEKIVVATLYTDFIEIYNINGVPIKFIRTQNSFDPTYKAVAISDNYYKFSYLNETQECYSSAAVTEQYIYVVYNGTLFKDNIWGGHVMHVFDWDGNYVKSYEFDDLILDFVVDKDDKKMYAIQNQELPTVKIYPL